MKKFLIMISTIILINSVNIFSYADEMVPGFKSKGATIISKQKVAVSSNNNNIIIYCVIGAIIVATLATIILLLINRKNKEKQK